LLMQKWQKRIRNRCKSGKNELEIVAKVAKTN